MFTHRERNPSQPVPVPVQFATPPRIRTYKTRRGRVTRAEQHALDEVWPRLGLELATVPLDPGAVFGRHAPLILEIGFGMGEATAALAAAQPDRDVLAIDVHTPGVGSLLGQLAARQLTNVRVLTGDAVPLLTDMLGPGQLNEIRIFFPDPWPKSRHAKRRLMSPEFVRLAGSRLGCRGRLHLATDVEPYARQALTVLQREPLFTVASEPGERPSWRPTTRFERRAISAGRQVFDISATRVCELPASP